MERLNVAEWAAVALAGAFIWVPLFMAPVPPSVAKDVAAITQQAVDQNEWQRIVAGTHVTDWLLALVGFGQLIILGRQAGVAERQNVLIEGQSSLAQQAYVGSHRPKIIVRDVYLIKKHGADGNPLRDYLVHYQLTNIGASKARVIAGGFVSHKWRKVYQPFASDDHIPDFPSPVTLQPGEFVEDFVPVVLSSKELDEIMVSFELQKMKAVGIADFDLVFRGHIVYVDDAGVKRRTSVWRTCEGPPSLRMRPVDDADYEYAD